MQHEYLPQVQAQQEQMLGKQGSSNWKMDTSGNLNLFTFARSGLVLRYFK